MNEMKDDETWQERVTQAKAVHDDFDAVVSASDVYLPSIVLGAIQESEVGPQLAYLLAKDDSAGAKRLRLMTITAQLRELGRLEARLLGETPHEAAPKAPPCVTVH